MLFSDLNLHPGKKKIMSWDSNIIRGKKKKKDLLLRKKGRKKKEKASKLSWAESMTKEELFLLKTTLRSRIIITYFRSKEFNDDDYGESQLLCSINYALTV